MLKQDYRARPDRTQDRVLALIPAATLAAIIFYVHLGGPLMLATATVGP